MPPLKPMLAKSVPAVPDGAFVYEPKWDGFRCIVFRDGDEVELGISHPCTTFDKWRWMPIVDEDYTVVDAIVTCF